MRYRQSLLALILFVGAVGCPAPSGAEDSCTVLESWCELKFESYADSSPTPVFYAHWNHGIDQGPAFDEHFALTWHSMDYSWTSRCDASGILCHGSWTEFRPDHWMWNGSHFWGDAGCSLEVLEAVDLLAERLVTGTGSTAEHTVTVTDADGFSVDLLAAGEFPRKASMTLEPGIYQIELHIAYHEATHYAYSGAIDVNWLPGDNVAAEISSWGEVKSLYR